MKLSAEQLAQYEQDGYLFFPELFSPAEVERLQQEVDRVSRLDTEMIFREGDAGQVKAMFRLHEPEGPTASAAFRAAAHTPRVLGLAQQVLGDDALYIHHTKVNMKPAIQGSAWPWHQDFGAWHLDGIAAPHMTTVLVMLQDATALNGCLYFLPGSHKANRIDPYWDESTAYKLWAVGPDDMAQMMGRYPAPVEMSGKAGSTVIFDCNLLHSSGHNLSPVHRWQAYFCFNRVSNRPQDVDKPRPDFVRSRNWTPLQQGSDEAVLGG